VHERAGARAGAALGSWTSRTPRTCVMHQPLIGQPRAMQASQQCAVVLLGHMGCGLDSILK
jgi:hypothetical protein